MSVTDRQRLTEVLELLSHPRRRFILHYLQYDTGPIDLDALARQMAAWEGAETPINEEKDTVQQIRASLHHAHLPALAESRLVLYDSSGGRIETTDRTVMDRLIDEEILSERHEILSNVL